MEMNRILSCLGIATLVAICGCNDGPKQNSVVQGRVTIDGVLADQGTISFHPEGGGPIAYGTIHKDGSFAMQIGQGRVTDLDQSEIFPGDYVATVAINAPSTPDKERGEGAPPIPGVRITSSKYSSKETSDLRFTVKPGLNVFDIPVERATPEELQSLVASTEEATQGPDDAKTDSPTEAASDSTETSAENKSAEQGESP